MRFDAGYAEDETLRDGTAVRLRLVRPEDAAQLARGLERLSPESRYRRFLSARTSFLPGELDYLTRVDGVHHVAIIAVRLDRKAETDGIGIARFVEIAPRVAEPAIVVLDEHQRKGLGRMLLERLHDAAVERGIETFQAEVLVTNTPMRAILVQIGATEVHGVDEGVMDVAIPLGPLGLAPHGRDHPLHLFLGLAARGSLALRGILKQRHAPE
ncbi:MAG: GNAT family N-acetyltransferase [Acidobacteriota bacterium]